MVDGVNFNPFTMKAWSTEEIQQLDTDGDDKISEAEVKAQWSWLSGNSQDAEGDVAIDDNAADGLFANAQKAGVTQSAETEDEFKSNMSIVADEFVEQYMTQHPEITDNERAAIQKLISTTSTSFITDYLAQSPEGPWDMQKVVSDFQTKMDEAIANNNAVMNTVNSTVSGYKNNVDTNFDSMTNLTRNAVANNNISNSEWNSIRNKSVQYLMGMMMGDSVNADFLKNIDPNYTKNENYKAAMQAINELKDTADPIQMQQYMTTAQNALNKMLNEIGRDKVADSIETYAQAKEEAAVTEKVKGYADNWAESQITADMSDSEKAKLNTFATNCITKFAAKMAEEGRFATSMSDNEIQAEFSNFITQQKARLDQSQQALTRSASGLESDYQNMVSISDAAAANGNISAEEKSNLISSATNLIINQLLNDMENIPVMEGLNADYKNSTDFKTLQTLITNLKASADPDEIAQLKTQAQELVTKMLDAYTGDQLVKAVDSTKPIEVTGATRDNVIYNSALFSEYQANVSRSTSRGKQDDGRLDEIQNMAKADLNTLAESLKAQLKSELGTAYDEAEIQKYINDAINDTLATFTQNVSRRNGHGNYNTGADEQAFVFLRRSGTSKGRYVYNLQALTNTFLDNFNAASKIKNDAKNDPSQATYDKENVIADSLGNEYNRDVRVKNNDQTALFNTAKAKLQQVAAALKASLIAEGCNVSSTEIDSIVNDSMQETMTTFNFNTTKPEGLRFLSKDYFNYISNRNSFSTQELVDTFMNKVDVKLEEAKEKAKQ